MIALSAAGNHGVMAGPDRNAGDGTADDTCTNDADLQFFSPEAAALMTLTTACG